MAIYFLGFSTYTNNLVDSDIGLPVVIASGGTGTLVSFDNSNKRWCVDGTSLTIGTGSVTITGGTAGTKTCTTIYTQPVQAREQEHGQLKLGVGVSTRLHTNLTIALSFVQLVGIADGSQYKIARTSSGELIAEGTAGSTTVTTPLFNFFGDFQADVIIRKGSSDPKYLPYSAAVQVTGKGGFVYVSQVLDPIAQ